MVIDLFCTMKTEALGFTLSLREIPGCTSTKQSTAASTSLLNMRQVGTADLDAVLQKDQSLK